MTTMKEVLSGEDQLTNRDLKQMSYRLARMKQAVTGLLGEIERMESRIKAARQGQPLADTPPISQELQ